MSKSDAWRYRAEHTFTKPVTIVGDGHTKEEAVAELKKLLRINGIHNMPEMVVVEKYCSHPFDRGRNCSVCGQYVRGDDMG